MNYDRVKNRYVADGVSAASPIQIIAMLYERAIRDLNEADSALENANWNKAHETICHAQEIVIELNACLDVTKWSGGPTLKSIYEYLISQLMKANMRKDRNIIATCRKVLEPLSDAWNTIAAQHTAQTGVDSQVSAHTSLVAGTQ